MSDTETRIGFFTDLHISGKTPNSRHDDFTQATLDKLAFCLRRCAEARCDVIVFGGDFTHSHKLTNDRLKERVIDVMCDNLPNDLPFLYTYGQHDLYGESLGSKEESTTSFIMRMLSRMGKEIVELPHDSWIARENTKGVWFSACPRGVEPVGWFEKMSQRSGTDGTKIAVVHHLVSDQDSSWLLDYKSLMTGGEFDGSPIRTIDVVLSGDLHCGFGPVLNELGSLFVNPGSLARTSKTKKELERPVRGVDIVVKSTDEGVYCEAQDWLVDVARPASEVFMPEAPVIDDETYEFDEAPTSTSDDIDAVISRLSSLQVRRVDVWELLERRAKEANLAPDVLSYLMRRRPSA